MDTPPLTWGWARLMWGEEAIRARIWNDPFLFLVPAELMLSCGKILNGTHHRLSLPDCFWTTDNLFLILSYIYIYIYIETEKLVILLSALFLYDVNVLAFCLLKKTWTVIDAHAIQSSRHMHSSNTHEVGSHTWNGVYNM
jgi:hypothetical protein